MRPMYECIVVQSESPQVLDAEGPLDGSLQWEYQPDQPRRHSDSWSLSVGAVSDTSESLEREGDTVGRGPVSPSTDDVVSRPRTGPGSPMREVEST